MKLVDLLSRNAIFPELKGADKESVIEELSDGISRAFPACSKNEVMSSLIEREKLGSTGIENGVAIPHAKIKGLNHIILFMGRSKSGIDFSAHDGRPSYLFFVLLAPEHSTGDHLKTLARLSRLLKNDAVIMRLIEAKTRDDIYNIIVSEDNNLPC